MTNTCYQKKHSFTSPIGNLIDSGEWQIIFPHFYNIGLNAQKKIEKVIIISYAGLLMCV